MFLRAHFRSKKRENTFFFILRLKIPPPRVSIKCTNWIVLWKRTSSKFRSIILQVYIEEESVVIIEWRSPWHRRRCIHLLGETIGCLGYKQGLHKA